MDIENRTQASVPTVRKGSRARIFLVVFTSCVFVIATAAIAARWLQSFRQNALREQITRNLTQKAQAFAARLNSDRHTKLADLTSQVAQQAEARATVVDGNGNVMADSQVPLSALEKEGDRPEFTVALRGGVGIQIRSHGRFGIPVLYIAVPVSGGAVRLSTSLAEMEIAAAQSRRHLLWGCGTALIIALVISAATARMMQR